jgi:phosphoglycerate dehydrogenase-like enzyme
MKIAFLHSENDFTVEFTRRLRARLPQHDPKNPLMRLAQVLITPHIAGSTDLMLSGTVNYIAQVVEDFEAGKKPKSILNTPQKPRRVLRA